LLDIIFKRYTVLYCKTWHRKGIQYCECAYSKHISCMCCLHWGILVCLIGFLFGSSSALFISIIYSFSFFFTFYNFAELRTPELHAAFEMQARHYLYGGIILFFCLFSTIFFLLIKQIEVPEKTEKDGRW